MKKNIKEFTDDVVEELGRKLGNSCMASAQTLWKNNGVLRHYAVITDKEHQLSPCYDMQNYYELYREPGDIQLTADDIIKAYRREYFPDFAAEWLLDREKVLKRAVFRIAGTFNNSRLLENAPNYDIPGLDISLLYYILADTGKQHYASILLRNRHMEMLGISEKELLKNALKNTPAEMNHVICSIEELVCGDSKKASSCVPCPAEMKCMHVITNRQRLYGAGCILYPGVLAEAAQKLGSGFYILPSSVHETIIIPEARFDINHALQLKTIVMAINRTELDREDVLTDSVYYYDCKRNQLFVAA